MKPSSEVLRKNWRRNWISALVGLADSQRQKRWLDTRIKNPHWSFIEFMSTYFDDCNVSDTGSGYKKLIDDGFLTKNEFEAISEFHRALASYHSPNGDQDPKAILDDQKWKDIVRLGVSSLANLEALIFDVEEKRIFSEPLEELSTEDFTWGTKHTGKN